MAAGFPTLLEERLLDLPAIDGSHRVGERDILLELRETRRTMIAELIQRLRDGKITARNLESQRRSAFKGGRRARNRIANVLRQVGNEGMGHVREELERGS